MRDWDTRPAMYRNPDEVEGIPRPVVAVGNEYPPSHDCDWHRHRRGQLLYAAKGVIVVKTPYGAWVAPPERAVWTPGGIPHAVHMVGAVSTRGVLIDAGACPALGDQGRVIGVSPLLRQLLLTMQEIEPVYDDHSRDGAVVALLLAELARAPTIPLSVPFPSRPALAARCRAFLTAPSPHDTIDDWCADLGMGRRAFTRAFRRETGMSFVAWRQQACLLVALPRLAAGEPVTTIAFDLGYDSPAAFTTMVKRQMGIPPSAYQPQ